MRRRVSFLLAILAVALTFTGASGHVPAKHAYFGVFTTQSSPPDPAVFYGQDLNANEGGRVVAFGTSIKLTCFAKTQDLLNVVPGGHVFRAYGTAGGVRYGFTIVDSAASSDRLNVWRNARLTSRKTCSFDSPRAISLIGVGAAVG